MHSADATGQQAWADAQQVLQLVAVAPALVGGVRLRSWHSEPRDCWLAQLQALLAPDMAQVDLHPQVADDSLLGGLDVVATLQTGRKHTVPGLLAKAHGGILQVRVAERLTNNQLAAINQALDEGRVRLEREGLSHIWPAQFGCIALDEGVAGEESIAASLSDRLAFDLDLHPIALGDVRARVVDLDQQVALIRSARLLLPKVKTPSTLVPALCQSAWNLNIRSLRAPMLALQVSRIAAALAGSETVLQEHAEMAVRFVYGPRAIAAPGSSSESPPTPDSDQGSDQAAGPDDSQPPPQSADTNEGLEQARDQSTQGDLEAADAAADALAEVLVDVAQAALPAQLLQQVAYSKLRQVGDQGAGRFGPIRHGAARGIPLASRVGKLGGTARLDLVATLRRAIPWQRMRRESDQTLAGQHWQRPIIKAEDFSIKRFKQHAPTVTLFVVDASGSAAMQRLAEAKGAVEALLAQCYIRRDEVGLIAFRGTSAELLLPPTRSLVRAKRVLGQLVGGGGTPLAHGLQAALLQTKLIHRRGAVPLIVLLTDGGANVSLAGEGNRVAAQAEAKALAASIGEAGEAIILVDTSKRGQRLAQEMAELSHALYVPLPYVQQGVLVDQVLSFSGVGQRAVSAR